MICRNPIEVVLVEGNWWQDISILISGFAAMIALGALGHSIYRSRKEDRRSQTAYFFKLVEEILVNDFPVARRSLVFDKNSNSLTDGYMLITDVIEDLRKKIQFFYFQDKVFYNEIETMLVSLDEMIIMQADKQNVEVRYQNVFLNEVDCAIAQIYKKLLNKHVGK